MLTEQLTLESVCLKESSGWDASELFATLEEGNFEDE